MFVKCSELVSSGWTSAKNIVSDKIPDMAPTIEKIQKDSKATLKSFFKIAKAKSIQFFGIDFLVNFGTKKIKTYFYLQT